MIWTYFDRGHAFECQDRLRPSFLAEACQHTPVKVTTYAVEWRRSGASGAGSPFDLIFYSQSLKHWALGFLFFHVFSALLWKSRAIDCIECRCCFKSGGHAVSKSNRVHLTGSLTQTWTNQSLSSIWATCLCFKQFSMSVHFVGGFQLMVVMPCEFWPMPLAELPWWWRSVTTLVSTAES